jgi:hypothetical protein
VAPGAEVQQQSTAVDTAVARWNLSDQGCSGLTRELLSRSTCFLEQYFLDTGLVIEGWLSVAVAAERLGIPVQRVRQLLLYDRDGGYCRHLVGG